MLNQIIKMLSYSVEATIICCIIVAFYCLKKHYTKKLQIEDLLVALFLVLIAGLRYEVGSDYTRYLESYNYAALNFSNLKDLFNLSTLNKYSFEIGYEVLSSVVNKIFGGKYTIFWIVAIIIYIPIIFYCRKKTNDPYISFAVFILFGFFGLSLNILKQAIAMMILLYIYEFIKAKRYIIATLYSILAFSFHTTAIIPIIFIVILCSLHNNKGLLAPTQKNLRLLIFIGIGFRFFTSALLYIINKIDVLTKYASYLDTSNSRIDRTFIWIGALLETIIVIAILNIAIKKKDELLKKNSNIEDILSIIMFGIPFSIVGISRQLWLANRFSKYFFLFLIVLIPTMMGKGKYCESGTYLFPKKTRTYFWMIMIIWHIAYSILMMDNNYFCIKSYLFGV